MNNNNDNDWKERDSQKDEVSPQKPNYDAARGRQERPFGSQSDHNDNNIDDSTRRTWNGPDRERADSSHSKPSNQGRSPGGRRILSWVAMALACILIGGSAGGLLVYGLMESRVQQAESSVTAPRDDANGSGQDPDDRDDSGTTSPTLTDPESTDSETDESEGQPTTTRTNTNQNGNTNGNGFDMATATNQTPEDDAMSTIEIAAKASPSVVAVYTEVVGQDVFGRPVTGIGAGSGVVISADGYIVTNYHVVEGAEEIHVDLPNGKKQVAAELVGTEPSSDLAVLKLDPSEIPDDGLPAIRVADSDALQVGELAMAIGNPLGDLQGSVSLGIVSALDRQVTIGATGGTLVLEGNIQTDAAINSGNSGGALVNAKGELIGINVAKASSGASGASVEGIGFAIPVNKVVPIVNDLINYGYVTGKPRIGVTGRAITVQYRQGYNMPAGVMVQGVADGSGAADAGIQIGDIIISVDGESITTVTEINQMVEQKSPGDSVELGIIRGQNEISVEVVLSEWVPSDDVNR